MKLMADLKDIAGKHIEAAKSLQSSSIKYLVGFTLIVLFCWYFAERVFSKTKFESIRYNLLEQKLDSFKQYYGRLSTQQQNDYDSLKKKRNVQDSTTAETYKAVEENIPSGFKFLLRQATKKPYGILLTSITVLIFIFYLFHLRKNYLSKLGVAFRIIKSNGGINEIYDYNFRLPFWALPVPRSSVNNVDKRDLLLVGGLNKKEILHNLCIILLLITLIFIQYRLYYISLITNSFLLSWALIFQSIILLASLLIAILWVLPSTLRDTYNHEPYSNTNSRRNFILSSSLLLVGGGLAFVSNIISKSIIHKLLKPRFVKNKKPQKLSNCRKVELTALGEIKQKNFAKAASILFTEINQPKSIQKLQHYTRLFDLLILLCSKRPEIKALYFGKTVDIAKKSGVKQLKERSVSWISINQKKQQKQKERSQWDNNKI
jgi:hypothetical protein